MAKLEPHNFCRYWVKSPLPGNLGYRQACIKLLAEATGLVEGTINAWGRDFQDRPNYILNMLEKDHIFRSIQQKTSSVAALTLTDIGPWEYCVYWINNKSPDEYGFRAECVRELTKATREYYKKTTIHHKWGPKFEKCPKLALDLIKITHYLKLMQQILYIMAIPEDSQDSELYETMLNIVNILVSESNTKKEITYTKE